MIDFLARMAEASARRVAAARRREPEGALVRRALASPAPPRLALHPSGFDLIAEVKRRSPSRGVLAARGSARVVERAAAYARAGAAAVSVLTEPTRFGGALAHLADVAAALPVPALRKDFLVDPYQVFEARAAGAGGVLVIVRMLGPHRAAELLAAAREAGLFVLLEAFDAEDLAAARGLAAPDVLIGLNVRDLRTLAVAPARFEALVGAFPAGAVRVAESALRAPEDAARVARLGYALALVGEALMDAPDPGALVAAMLASGRRAACASA